MAAKINLVSKREIIQHILIFEWLQSRGLVIQEMVKNGIKKHIIGYFSNNMLLE